MRWLLVSLAILALITGYSYITVSNGPIEPLGRNAFVKLLNPDFYPGHPHSELFADSGLRINHKNRLPPKIL